MDKKDATQLNPSDLRRRAEELLRGEPADIAAIPVDETRRLELLNRIGAEILREIPLEKVLEDTLLEVCRFLDLPRSAIRWKGMKIGLIEHCNPDHSPLGEDFCLYLDSLPSGGSLEDEDRGITVVDDVLHSPCSPEWKAEMSRFRVGAYLGVPLRDPQGLAGVFFLCSEKPRAWTVDETATAVAIGRVIEIAASHSRIFRGQQELAGRLLSLLNNIPGVVYRGLKDWSLVFIGADVERITGFTPEEFMTGRANWRGLIHGDDLEHVKNLFRGAVQEGRKVLHVEYRAMHRDGTVRWISDRRQLSYNGDGSFAYVDGLLLDITEQKQALEQNLWNYHTQQALTSILQISLERLTLREKLEWAMDVLFHVPWLRLETKGCFFLVGKEPETLVMEAHRGLPPEMLSACGTVRLGECLCGKAAATRQILFTAGGDEAHTRFPDQSHTHGHYCVPIVSGETLLGVLNLYLKAGHEENPREVVFLTAVGRILAGFIELDHAGEELRRLATAVKQAGEIMMITDTRGDIQYVNPVFEKVTGYTCMEVMGKNPRILNSGKQDGAFYKEMWSVLLREGTWTGRLTNRRNHGKHYEQDTVNTTVYDASGNVVN